ncbi:MAG: hypothetical protein HeimAB125_00720 [Candidatus Heimdallarchaeota archaeon AB_125]|nr:MAG: hypothetical protein HeimAB125_00720 [Candidatus Heimdallarchaeota archaeon AB_125]
MLLILGSPLLIYFIEENRCIKLEEDLSFMRIDQGKYGYFFFDENSDIHISYRYFNELSGSDFGWTMLDYGKKKIKICNKSIEDDSPLISPSSIKGIKHKEWYYIFASGLTGLWSPVVFGIKSKNLKDWEPVPSFNPSSTHPTFKRFIDTDVDSNGNLICCFSDASGMISGIPNYSFYLLNISKASWSIDTITFEGNLSDLLEANFILWNNNPTISWACRNESLYYNILKLSTRKKGIWLNDTITYTNQSLWPCGFEEGNGRLNAYFCGYNFDGPTNETTYTKTKLYKAIITDSNITSDELFYYPEKLYFSDRSIHQRENGRYSLFFQIEGTPQRIHYYAELMDENLTLYEVKVYEGLDRLYSYFRPLLAVRDDTIYLLWGEVIHSYTAEYSIYHLYFVKFSDVQNLETLLQSDPFIIETLIPNS